MDLPRIKPSGGEPVGPGTGELGEALLGPLDRLEDEARALFGPDYAGVTTDDAGPVVFVRRNPKRQRPTMTGAAVAEVDFSEGELHRAQDSLFDHVDQLTDAGIRISHFGIDPATNSLSVAVIAPTDPAHADAEIRRRVTPGVRLTVHQVAHGFMPD